MKKNLDQSPVLPTLWSGDLTQNNNGENIIAKKIASIVSVKAADEYRAWTAVEADANQRSVPCFTRLGLVMLLTPDLNHRTTWDGSELRATPCHGYRLGLLRCYATTVASSPSLAGSKTKWGSLRVEAQTRFQQLCVHPNGHTVNHAGLWCGFMHSPYLWWVIPSRCPNTNE